MKMTRNDVKDMSRGKVLQVGYCDMYYLLKDGAIELGYNHGVYGWNWTCYRLPNGQLLTTGYRSTIGTHIPSEVWKKYEAELEEFKKDWKKPYPEVRAKAEELLNRICEEMAQ